MQCCPGVSRPETALLKRQIVMADGSGIKRSLSELFNPDTAGSLLGGEAAPTTIVRTTLRSMGETPVARELYKRLRKAAIVDAKRIDAHYHIAPNALARHAAGWRLTPGIECSPEMDL